MSAANVLAVEMECAALFTVGLLRGVTTAAILAVDGNVLEARRASNTYKPHRDTVKRAVEAAIDIAAASAVRDQIWTSISRPMSHGNYELTHAGAHSAAAR